MRHFALVLVILLTTPAVAAPKLSSKEARQRISQLTSSKIFPDAIEVRRITSQGDNEAIAETTVGLAFDFKKDANGEWAVDSVRLGYFDWVKMSELLAAVHHGNPPVSAAIPPPQATPPARPSETLHANPSTFDRARKRMLELGMSRLVPDAIEIRRVTSQSDVRTIAEATVTMGFRFKRTVSAGGWAIEAARLGDRDWVNTQELLAVLDEGRRRDTVARMEKLSAGIEAYRAKNGSLPGGRDVVTLTDILHPNHMPDLVRLDGWGQPFEYEASGSTFRLISKGADGRRGTPDDLIFP